MRGLDFSSWHSVLTTLIGLAVFTLIGVGIRLLMMVTFQQRRERYNRQINERLRTLIAAYKVLGGSFTGDLFVDPTHLRDLRQREAESQSLDPARAAGDRSRRVRDAVEAALSDVILLGTERQVELAAIAVRELVAGRPVHTDDLVLALRDFIREALDLDPIPASVVIPRQGPARPSGSGGKGEKGRAERSGGGGQGGGMGGGMGGGGGLGVGLGHPTDDDAHR